MNVFDSVKKVVTKTAKDAAKVSGELVEQTKLKLKVVELKDEINERYKKVGELYYTATEYELDNGDKINSLISEIKALKSELEDVEAEVKRNKSIKKCSVYDAENGAEDDYCSKCGNKLN
ncbi:MAG: hypothetical protein IJN62_06050 [Clostridia bacterium]|nr:hypothetical protein [Clostridia bacterium]